MDNTKIQIFGENIQREEFTNFFSSNYQIETEITIDSGDNRGLIDMAYNLIVTKSVADGLISSAIWAFGVVLFEKIKTKVLRKEHFYIIKMKNGQNKEVSSIDGEQNLCNILNQIGFSNIKSIKFK